MPSLRSTLDSLAQSFASAVLEAIRSASIDDLTSDGVTRRPRAARDGEGGVTGTRPGRRKRGPLARRSAEDIARALGSVVALLKATKTGLRSEEIRKSLGVDKRELPRVLKEGLATKKIKSKGQKRATTYTAA